MTLARRLTPEGIEYARELLAEIRKASPARITLPNDLLFSQPYSAPLADVKIDLEPRSFADRRSAANYLTLRLQAYGSQLLEEYNLWSWLGMFYLPTNHNTRGGSVRLLKRDETYVLHSGDENVKRRRYVHYLWSAWQLQRHQPGASYLLDTALWDYSDMVDRVFSSQRVFHSTGVVDLIQLLYTEDGGLKPEYGRSAGGIRRLLIVLEQLERIYDVYGMDAEHLSDILPPEFDRWQPDHPRSADASPRSPSPAEHGVDRGRLARIRAGLRGR